MLGQRKTAPSTAIAEPSAIVTTSIVTIAADW